MIESDPQEAELLARARREFSPTAGDAARVRRAIGAAIAAGSANGEAGPSTTHSASDWLRLPASGVGGWPSRLLVAGAIAAAGVGAGYWAGHRAGLREASTTRSALGPSAGPSDRLVDRPSPGTLTPVSTAAAAPSRLDAPSIEAPAPSGDPPASVFRRNLAGQTAQTAPPSAAESLEIEVRALRNIQRALRDGNPGLALAFLQDLDRAVPHGQLTEERTATAALARCARGDVPFGVNLAEDFTNRYPDSVYRERVEQACAPTDSTGPGDSSERRPGR